MATRRDRSPWTCAGCLTVDALLADLPDEEWIYWGLHDKYLIDRPPKKWVPLVCAMCTDGCCDSSFWSVVVPLFCVPAMTKLTFI